MWALGSFIHFILEYKNDGNTLGNNLAISLVTQLEMTIYQIYRSDSGILSRFTQMCMNVYSRFEEWTVGGPHVPQRWWLAKEKWPPPSQETPVHTKIFSRKHNPPTGNKNYKTWCPTGLVGTTVLWVPPCPPHYLSFLFTTNKSFLIFIAQVSAFDICLCIEKRDLTTREFQHIKWWPWRDTTWSLHGTSTPMDGPAFQWSPSSRRAPLPGF
jgi:hypothetical protein